MSVNTSTVVAKEVGFITACKEFFGMKEGQKLTEFRDEIKALTPADRIDLTAELAKVGYNIKAESAS